MVVIQERLNNPKFELKRDWLYGKRVYTLVIDDEHLFIELYLDEDGVEKLKKILEAVKCFQKDCGEVDED